MSVEKVVVFGGGGGGVSAAERGVSLQEWGPWAS